MKRTKQEKIIAENMVKLAREVAEIRREFADWDKKVVTTISVNKHNIASYTFLPKDPTGYTVEMDLTTGKTRNCGNGTGCFWTNWE